MNVFRFPVLQRVIVLLLCAGASVACVPVASASTGSNSALADELRALLGDSDALELALEAARRGQTHEAAVEAFTEAYTEATGDLNAASEIARLLSDHPNRFGAPVLPLTHAVWTVASSTAPLVQRTDAATQTSAPPDVRLAVSDAVVSAETPVRPTLRTLRTQQARAP